MLRIYLYHIAWLCFATYLNSWHNLEKLKQKNADIITNKLCPKKSTRTTLREKEIDEREECLKGRAYRKKNPDHVKLETQFIKKRLDLYNELFESKLKANPAKKAEKLSNCKIQ